MADIIFTSSWDDGHPLDAKLAGLLDRHNLTGTFYIPRNNVEGRAVMDESLMAELADRFEVGGHTLDHKALGSLPPEKQHDQITNGKKWQEDVIGKTTAGFCYPCGEHDQQLGKIVEKAGYRYARTVENMTIGRWDSRYRMGTTIQFYPHNRSVYVKNVATNRTPFRKLPLLGVALKHSSLVKRLESLFAYVQVNGGIFHLWGHSWEINEIGGWEELDEFFAYVNARVPQYGRLTNHQVAELVFGVR